MLDGHARPLLDRVARGDGGVVRGAGGEDDDPAQHLQRVVAEEAFELEPAVAHAIADRLGDGVGLLVDLLQHERLEAGLLGALVVPVELDQLTLDRAAVLGAQEAGTVGRDRDEVAVLGEVHLARLAQKRCRVGGEERLVAADADDERALHAGADEQARVVAVDRDEGEVTLELVEREARGLDEIAVVVLLDQVADRLGVRLGGEDVPGLAQPLAQLAVVLDDAVEHDRELLRILDREGMRVLLGDAAVGRPARVTEAGRGGRGAVAGGELQVLEVADGPCVREPVLLEEGDAGRVIAAVLEALEAVEEQVLALTRSYVSDDPAHWRSSFVGPRLLVAWG